MTGLLHRLRRLAHRRASGPPPLDDTIGRRLRAAIDANAQAKLDNSRCYAARVHTMIEDLFLKMDRDAHPHV